MKFKLNMDLYFLDAVKMQKKLFQLNSWIDEWLKNVFKWNK